MSEIHGDIQGNCEVRVKFPCGICFQGSLVDIVVWT